MQERLHVAGGEPALAKEPLERVVGVRVVETADALARRRPEGVRRAKEGALLAVVVERAADPRAACDRGVERRRGVLADEGGGQRGGGLGRGLILAQRRAGGRLGALAGQAHEARGHAGEAQGREGTGHLGGVEGGEARVGEVELDRRVGANRGHAAAEQGVVHVRAEVLAHLAGDLVRVRDDLVQASVLHDQRGRLLGADARHAGDVVGGVALEAVESGTSSGVMPW